MSKLLQIACALLALAVAGCSEEASSSASNQTGGDSPPPAIHDDPAVKAPADWKLERDVVAALAFSPDGKTLATACDNAVILWDTVKGERRTELKDPQRSGVTLAWSPDGKLVATGATGGGVNVWEAESGKPLWGTRLDRGVKAVGFADNGAALLAVIYYNDHLEVKGFDARGGTERFSTRVKGHVSANAEGKEEAREAGAVAFSADGKVLATAASDAHTWDPNIRLWDVRSGQERDRFGIAGNVESLAFSRDGATLAAADHAGQVRLWDLRGGAGAGKSLGIFGEPDQPGRALAFSPDGRLVAGSSQRFVRLFSVPGGSPHATIEIDLGSVDALAFSPGGRFIAFADNLGKLHTRAVPAPGAQAPGAKRDDAPGSDRSRAAPGVVVLEDASDPRSGRPFFAVAFSPDGKTVAAASEDRAVRLFDASTRRRLFLLEGQPGLPIDLDFSPDGKLLASAGSELMAASSAAVEPANSVRVWDVATGKDRGFFVTQKDTFPGVCFAPDGRSIAAPDADGVVRLFDTATLKPRDGLTVKVAGQVSAVGFSRDGKRLAIGSGDKRTGKLLVVDAASGAQQLAKDFDKPVMSVAFSPDGRWIAAVGGGVTVLDAASGKEVATPQHRYYPSCAAFSPDGKTLATSGGEIKLWDAGKWKQRDEYTPPRSDEFRSIAWSPDGRCIAVGGARAVFLWTPQP